MKFIPFTILIIIPTILFAQVTPGDFYTETDYGATSLLLRPDSTFTYSTHGWPYLFSKREFKDSGRWAVHGDTVVLNPHLPPKPIIESELIEGYDAADTAIRLSFHLIIRKVSKDGIVTGTDTLTMSRSDYSINSTKKRHRACVADHGRPFCAFAGWQPRTWFRNADTVVAARPRKPLQYLYFRNFELGSDKKFRISNPNATRLYVNVIHNVYEDGLLRQHKLLAANNDKLFIEKRRNGSFVKHNLLWFKGQGRLYRQKG